MLKVFRRILEAYFFRYGADAACEVIIMKKKI